MRRWSPRPQEGPFHQTQWVTALLSPPCLYQAAPDRAAILRSISAIISSISSCKSCSNTAFASLHSSFFIYRPPDGYVIVIGTSINAVRSRWHNSSDNKYAFHLLGAWGDWSGNSYMPPFLFVNGNFSWLHHSETKAGNPYSNAGNIPLGGTFCP